MVERGTRMGVTETGTGPLFQEPDADGLRAYFAAKNRSMVDKCMNAAEAVTRFIPDGCFLAAGGFGTNRIPTEILHEVVRQRRRNLTFLGHTSTHDFEILCAGNCLSRVDAAYIVGLEARGLSPVARRVMQSGEVEVCEWTNYALSVRLRAAADGLPFGVLRSMLGTDTFVRSAAKVIECPYTGQKLTAVPACSPDVAVVHVHEADAFGNARIHGISVADMELVRAAKRVVVTTERLIDTDEIRRYPEATMIPFYLVDAVVHSPYGSYPGNMPYEYFSDEDHLAEWLAAERDPEVFAAFLEKHIYGVAEFQGYLEICGGEARLAALKAEERLE